MNRDRQWTIRLEGEVLVVEFPHGTVLSPADGEALLDRWRAVTMENDIAVAVIIVSTSRFCSDAARHTLRTAARVGVERGIARWAVVAEGPKRRYLERTVDVVGVVVESFNDDDIGLAWARRPTDVVV